MSEHPPPDEFPSSAPDVSGGTFQAQLARPDTPPPRQSCASWFFILFMITVVVGPVVYFWLPGEIARWHQAAIIEQSLNGDLAGAIENLSRTIEQYPDQAGLYRLRADWYRQIKEYQAALQDCDRALELAPGSFRVYLLRSQVHQHRGDFDKGVEDLKKVLAISEKRQPSLRPTALNALAYARALAKSDLDEALAEVDEALSIPGVRETPEMFAACLDTRGYIHYLRGDYEAARKDLDQSVDLIEELHAQEDKELNGEHPGVLDLREGRLDLKKFEQHVAVIRYHRQLLYEALQMKAEAEQDLERVRELGHEPGEHLF